MSTKTKPIASLSWKCRTCRTVFEGPTDHKPAEGCPECGSPEIIDLNAVPVRPTLRTPGPGKLPARQEAARVELLVRNLRIQATGMLNPQLARELMKEAAEEIERLSQLPLL